MAHPAKLAALSIAIGVVCATPAAGQLWARLTNPTVKVNVMHPPYLSLKGVTRVAVSEFQGECGAELTDRLTELVGRSGKFEVLDRLHLQSMLGEQDFGSAGRVDARAAVRLGKVLGPAALIFGRVTRCRTEPNNQLVEKDSQGQAVYISRTRVNVTASVQLVELATSRILSAQIFEGAAELTNRSREGRPELPDANLLMTQAYSDLVTKVSRLILPWPETVELLVYDDKDWGLKSGAALVKAGQFSEAVAYFKRIVDEHQQPAEKDYEKLSYRALHNLGVSMTYGGDSTAAIPILQRALILKPVDVTKNALAAAQKVANLEQAFRLQELQGIAVSTGHGESAGEPAGSGTAAKGVADQPRARGLLGNVAVSGTGGTKNAPTAPSANSQNASKKRPAAVAAPSDIETQLEKLKSIFTKGLITKEEYDQKRQELLKKFGG